MAQALGTRAKAVRAFRQQLHGAPDLARASLPAGDTLEVFVAAQVSDELSAGDNLLSSRKKGVFANALAHHQIFVSPCSTLAIY